MFAGEACSKRVPTIRSDATVVQAAQRMKQCAVGSLVVMGRKGPVEGILTDHDLVVRWAAEERSTTTEVSDVMTRGTVAILESTPVEEALVIMATQGLKRLLVTSGNGDLVGMLALDDILMLISEESGNVRRILEQPVHA